MVEARRHRHLSLVENATQFAREYATRDDEALVRATLAGEARAEEALFKRHVPAVHAVARRMLRDQDEAEDVVQDAFATAHERLSTLHDAAAFRGWLLQIAVRLVHRRYRRKKMLSVLGFTTLPDDGPGLADEARPDLSPEAKLDLRRLDAVLARVSATERLAWLLRCVDGLALNDVAEACDCSLATVKRRIARVQELVKAALGYDVMPNAEVHDDA